MPNQFQPNSQYQPMMYGQPQSPQMYPPAYTQQNLQAMQQRYAPMQAPQPQPQQYFQQPQYQAQPLMGNFVNDRNEVIAGKVPMDSNVMYFFPRVDGVCIYGGYWTADGQFKVVQFDQVVENAQNALEGETTMADQIMSELKEIKTMLSNNSSSTQSRNTSNRNQKKGNDNGNAQL